MSEYPRVTLSQMSLAPHIAIFGSQEVIENAAVLSGAEKVQYLPTRRMCIEIDRRKGLVEGSVIPFDWHTSWRKDTILEIAEGRTLRVVDELIRRVVFPKESVSDRATHVLMHAYPSMPVTVHALNFENTLGRFGKHPFQLELAPQNQFQVDDLIATLKSMGWNKLGIAYPVWYPNRDFDQFDAWKAKNVPQSSPLKNQTWEETLQELLPFIRSLHLGPLSTADINQSKQGVSFSSLSFSEAQILSAYRMGFRGDIVLEVDARKIAKVRGYREIKSTTAILMQRLRKIRDTSVSANLSQI